MGIMVGLVIIGFASSAYAYLDPGTGSYAIQVFIAFVLGALYAVRIYYAKIKAVVSKTLEAVKNVFRKK